MAAGSSSRGRIIRMRFCLFIYRIKMYMLLVFKLQEFTFTILVK